MFKRFPRKILAPTAAALLAALGVGGAAIAQSNNSAGSKAQAPAATQSPETPGQESNAPENSATDRDNVQQGDQTSPDKPGSAGAEAGGGKESATEQPGSEQPNSDGPGGHADEPGSPNADHQAQGRE